jgi:hypothetical protein
MFCKIHYRDMFKLLKSKALFAAAKYDLAIIGGGPGGISLFI